MYHLHYTSGCFIITIQRRNIYVCTIYIIPLVVLSLRFNVGIFMYVPFTLYLWTNHLNDISLPDLNSIYLQGE